MKWINDNFIIFEKDIKKCEKYIEEPEKKSRLISLLKSLDFNVSDVRMAGGGVEFFHYSKTTGFWCPQEDESTGLLNLFYLAPFIFQALDENKILIVDKKSTGLHQLIIKHLEHSFIEWSEGGRIIFI